jgi:NuA3 HAT complex component NTO1
MAPITTPRSSRSAKRPRPSRAVTDTAPPQKKIRYVPGGPGGGGRYVDTETGIETPVGGTGPGGYAYTGTRGRVGRQNAARLGLSREYSPPTTVSRSRRDRSNRSRRERTPALPRSNSTSAAAAAVAQSDGYKPREEREFQEFHPDLSTTMDLIVFSADDVDGITPPVTHNGTPILTNGMAGSTTPPNGIGLSLDEALTNQIRTPQLQEDESQAAGDEENNVSPTAMMTPKRKVGRPPRRGGSMLNGLGSPPAPRIMPLPSYNPKERLSLPKPNFRQVDTWSTFEQDQSVGVNFVNKSMASLGYQESDLFYRSEKTMIRIQEGSIEEDLDLAVAAQDSSEIGTGAVAGRVEYDMDEQDDRWLEALNEERKDEGVDALTPAIFEITMTQIEKEWHALEKRG